MGRKYKWGEILLLPSQVLCLGAYELNWQKADWQEKWHMFIDINIFYMNSNFTEKKWKFIEAARPGDLYTILTKGDKW